MFFILMKNITIIEFLQSIFHGIASYSVEINNGNIIIEQSIFLTHNELESILEDISFINANSTVLTFKTNALLGMKEIFYLKD